MTIQPAGCRTTQHCAVHDFCHRCMPSLDEATQHLVKAIDAAGITTGTGRVYAALAATIRDAARTAAAFETTMDSRTAPKAASNGAARQTTGQDDTDCPACGDTGACNGGPCAHPAAAPWIADGRHGPTPEEMADRRIPTCYVQFMGGAHCATAPAVGQPAEAHDTDRAVLRERVRLAVVQWHINESGSGRTLDDLDDMEFGTLADAVLSVLTVEDER